MTGIFGVGGGRLGCHLRVAVLGRLLGLSWQRSSVIIQIIIRGTSRGRRRSQLVPAGLCRCGAAARHPLERSGSAADERRKTSSSEKPVSFGPELAPNLPLPP